MPPRDKGGKDASGSRTNRTSTNPKNRKTGRKPASNQTSVTSLLRRTRSTTFIEPGLSYDDPEALLRVPRKSKHITEQRQPESVPGSTASLSLVSLPRTTSSPSTEEYELLEYDITDEEFSETTWSLVEDSDPEETFNHKWGYLPPLDEEAASIIQAIIANPEMAKSQDRINPSHEDFLGGLRDRNILVEASKDVDPELDSVKSQETGKLIETEAEKDSHGWLWDGDQAKCCEPSNEPLFQRTIMMNLIARHQLIYVRNSKNQGLLDFSVEQVWNCLPMPSRCLLSGGPLLTRPKPDLAVSFVREKLLPKRLWDNVPTATKRLACYEGVNASGEPRVFHFFTIEAKKAGTSTSDPVALYQCLNDASQALHNMFEFFKDAEHVETFFAHVRFFSVVASSEGIAIRIHRATRVPAAEAAESQIIDAYPLCFEYREFCNIPRERFQRKVVLEPFEKILIGYAQKLHGLLGQAAEALVAKLRKNSSERIARRNKFFYRYKEMNPSRKQTPATSREQSEAPNNQASATQDSAALSQQSQSVTELIELIRTVVANKDGSQNPPPALDDSRKRGPDDSGPEPSSTRRKLEDTIAS